MQRPTVDGSLHAWHCSSQALSQQTPSTQKPVAHWPPEAHCAPGPNLSMQMPAEQNLPAEHALSAAQPAQRAPLQAAGAQSCSCIGPQDPSPAQVRGRMATPVAQLAGVQTVDAPGYAQPLRFAPSQLPAHSGSVVAQAGRAPWGGPVTAVHGPSG